MMFSYIGRKRYLLFYLLYSKVTGFR